MAAKEPQEGLVFDPYVLSDFLGRPIPTEVVREDPGKWADYDHSYTSYAGTDIVATMVLPGEAPLVLGELHTLSYSIHRENVPVRFLGHSAPCGFTKSARTIAGHLMFVQFNKYVFYRLERFATLAKKGLFSLADMLPPFDLVVSFANESGQFSKMKIMGVNIIDEGGAMSVDDLLIEQEFTFMARAIQPMVSYVPDGMEAVKDWSPSSTGGAKVKPQSVGAGIRFN